MENVKLRITKNYKFKRNNNNKLNCKLPLKRNVKRILNSKRNQ